MRQVPQLRGFTRKLVPAAALGAVALVGGIAPAQAAGPPMQIEKEVEVTCNLDLGGFTLSNLALFMKVYAQVPSDVYVDDEVYIENSYAEIRVPGPTADALMYVNADTVTGVADIFTLKLDGADPRLLNVTNPPVAYGPQLLPRGTTTVMRVPNAGTLPPVGPITAAPGTDVGDSIVARLASDGPLPVANVNNNPAGYTPAMKTTLTTTNSQNPSAPPGSLPFNCFNIAANNAEDAQGNIVSEIPVVETPVTTVIPDATSVSPASFQEGDVSSVTLSGTDLNVVNSVTINGDSIDHTVNANGTITVDVAGIPAGEYDIVVSGPDGPDSTPVSLTVTEIPAVVPDATSVTPDTFQEGDELVVILDGSDLDVVDSVTIDGNDAEFAYYEGQIYVDVDGLSAGTHTIVVSGPDGADATPLTLTITEIPPVIVPDATSVSPASFEVGTQSSVTLSGTDLNVVDWVTINGAAADFTVNANGTVTVNVAGLAAGSYSILVSGPDGSDETPVSLTVTDPVIPVIPDATSVSPAAVTAGTAATVTLSGTDLGVVNSVKINGANATFTVNGNGTVTVNVPAQAAAGTLSIVVAGPDGADTTPVSLTVNPKPLVIPDATSVSPAAINTATAATVTLSGTNLNVVNSVKVNGANATYTVNSATSITVNVPAQAAAGTASIVVSGPDGADSTPVSLTVNPVVPDATSVAPTSVNAGSAATVTLSGTNLNRVNSVKLNGAAATYTVNGNGTVTVNVPAQAAAGTLSIVVAGPDGADATPVSLTVNPKPLVVPNATAVSPAAVTAGTAASVTLSGTNLSVVNSVKLNGVNATFTVNGNGTVTVNVPAQAAAGTISIVVAGPDGADTTPVSLTVNPKPLVVPNATSVSPSSVTVNQAASVTLSGTNLSVVNSVKIDGTAATFQVNSNGTVTVNVPAQSATGTLSIVVAGPDGADATPVSLSVTDAPTTNNKPVVKKLLPNTALALIGGVTIVSGDNLSTATKVTVGGKRASFVRVGGALIVVLPGLKKGTYDLVVTNKDGSSATSSAAKVKYVGLFGW